MTTDETELVRRVDAIRLLRISSATFDRWRKQGIIQTAQTLRPGVWVTQATVDELKTSRG